MTVYWCPYCENYYIREQTYYAHECFFGNKIPEQQDAEVDLVPVEDFKDVSEVAGDGDG